MTKSITPGIADALAMLDALTDIVVRAGEAILSVDRADMTVDGKHDGSPVTEADHAADRVIAAGLAGLAPSIFELSEERANQFSRCEDVFFLVDPLDGTKEYMSGRDEFTVNIALIAGGTPLVGVVGAPALGTVWRGVVGARAERIAMHGAAGTPTTLRTRPLPRAGQDWIAAVSRSHGDERSEAFIASRPGAVRRAFGSALKFCHVAEGDADIYPRLAPTCEWDVAAGHAVVVAAGGTVTDSRGQAVGYGGALPGFKVPEFIAWGDPSAVWPANS